MEPQEQDWLSGIVPEEYVLGRVTLVGAPVQPTMMPAGVSAMLGLEDWNWPQVMGISVAEDGYSKKNYSRLAECWRAYGGRLWVSVVDPRSGVASLDWMLLDAELAVHALQDVADSHFANSLPERGFLIAEDGSWIMSYKGRYSDWDIWMSAWLWPDLIYFEWPRWAQIALRAFPTYDWWQVLQEFARHGECSLYFACTTDLTMLVFDVLRSGSDAEVKEMFAMLICIEREGGGDRVFGITIWDDLAIEFYKDNPPAWVARLYTVMDPMDLWMDMVMADGMEELRRKVRLRQARLGY